MYVTQIDSLWKRIILTFEEVMRQKDRRTDALANIFFNIYLLTEN